MHVGSYSNFIQQALEELGIERVHLVLHDFGGPFGMLWGLQHPDAWRSTVLLNIGIMPGYSWHKIARRWRTPVLGELMMAWIPRSAGGAGSWPRPAASCRSSSSTRCTTTSTAAPARSCSSSTGPRPIRAREPSWWATPSPSSHKPTLVVWGMSDAFVAGEFADRQGEFFDVKRVVKLEDSGHWPFRDNPEAAAPPLLEFLREQLQQAPATPPPQP